MHLKRRTQVCIHRAHTDLRTVHTPMCLDTEELTHEHTHANVHATNEHTD